MVRIVSNKDQAKLQEPAIAGVMEILLRRANPTGD